MMGMVATKTGRMVVTMEKEMAKVVLAPAMAKAVAVVDRMALVAEAVVYGPVDAGALSTYEPSEVDERPRYVMRNPGARDEYERVGNSELRAKDLPKKEEMTYKKPARHKPQKPPKAKVMKSAIKSAMKSNAKAK
jgi:hypothetical protein